MTDRSENVYGPPMGRVKEFDPELALEQAMELFWEQGYEATSMAELVERLGVARASLYATFGGKRDLFIGVLERYVESTNRQVAAELSTPGPVLPAVRALVERYARESVRGRRPHGCMVVNTAVELGSRDERAARLVESSWSHLEAVLTSALLRARIQGEIAAGKDPAAIARLLLVLFQGMRVSGRLPGGGARLRDAVEQAWVAVL